MRDFVLGVTMIVLSAMLSDARGTVRLESGPERVALLELYTSEGCNSCPPADRWISALAEDQGLWRDVVPVSFHVDYWDYIGWKDRFASPTYSQRQREHAAARGWRTIYTPGFVLNGQEWRAWRRASSTRSAGLRKGSSVGELAVTVESGAAKVNYRSHTGKLKKPELYVAVLGFDLSTAVRAGENAGKSLRHDFVVLGMAEANLQKDGDVYGGEIRLPTPSSVASRYAVVAWVASEGDPAPIQAVGGWVPEAELGN